MTIILLSRASISPMSGRPVAKKQIWSCSNCRRSCRSQSFNLEAEGPQEETNPAAVEPEAEAGASAPASEFAPLSASLEEPEVPQKKNDAAASEETSAESLPHESLEEETQSRRSVS